jgi:ATP-dependent metalloprotease
MDVCMGGRAAEELMFGSENVTSGASNDIQQATRLAKAMVMKFGLSEKVGLLYLDDKERYSSETIQIADGEIKKLLTDSYSRSKSVLETNKQQLERIAAALLEYESLSGQELVDVMNGRKINVKQRSQKPSRELTQNVPLGTVLKPTSSISPSSNTSNNN